MTTEAPTKSWERNPGFRGNWADICGKLGVDLDKLHTIEFGEEAILYALATKEDGSFIFWLDDEGDLVSNEQADWRYNIQRVETVELRGDALIVEPRQDEATRELIDSFREALRRRR